MLSSHNAKAVASCFFGYPPFEQQAEGARGPWGHKRDTKGTRKTQQERCLAHPIGGRFVAGSSGHSHERPPVLPGKSSLICGEKSGE